MKFLEAFKKSKSVKRGEVEVTFFRTCREMILENYIEYLANRDLRWFTKEFIDHPDAEKAMTDFYGDLLSRTGNTEIAARFAKIHKILKLSRKYEAVTLLISAVRSYVPELGAEHLEKLVQNIEANHYRIDRDRELFSQIDRISNRIQGILTEVALIEAYLEKDDKKEEISIREQLINVARILDLKYRLDPKEMNVAEWLELQNAAKKQLEHEQRNRHNRKQAGA